MRYMSSNQKNYEPLIIPINKPFSELSSREAKEYFDWFVGNVDGRSEYIRGKVSFGLDISLDLLDYSADSLIYIWRWFLKIAECNKTPKSVIDRMRKELLAQGEGIEFVDSVVSENSMELSVFSRYVIRDIGMYVGKMFVTNYNTLWWDYHTDTEKDMFANIPQVFGFINTAYTPPFKERFDPIHYTEMQASKILYNTQQESDLRDMYLLWAKCVPV